MPSRKEQQKGARPPARQGGVDRGTRSGQPNPEDVPHHPDEHKSGYGGEGGSPRTSSDQREKPKTS